ncbi:unnamed protein product, partial [Ilex paraguariensis]
MVNPTVLLHDQDNEPKTIPPKRQETLIVDPPLEVGVTKKVRVRILPKSNIHELGKLNALVKASNAPHALVMSTIHVNTLLSQTQAYEKQLEENR